VAPDLEGWRPQRWRSWTGTVLAEATEASTGHDYETLWKAD
jgi:hypothetical protein